MKNKLLFFFKKNIKTCPLSISHRDRETTIKHDQFLNKNNKDIRQYGLNGIYVNRTHHIKEPLDIKFI